MSKPDPEGIARSQIKRWSPLVDEDTMRKLIESELSASRSQRRKEVYRAWLTEHPNQIIYSAVDPVIKVMIEGRVVSTTEVDEEYIRESTLTWLKDRFPEPKGWKEARENASED